MLFRRLACLAALMLLIASCSTAESSAQAGTSLPPSGAPTESPSSSPTAPPPTPRAVGHGDPVLSGSPEPPWVVGANPLPLRPDGFGEVLPTPDVLRDRSLPTASALPPPPDDGFHSAIASIDAAVRDRMGTTWQPGCPVDLVDLRYVTVSFWGFDGGHHTGELVLHADVASDVVTVFEQLHAVRFPIEEMRLITTADLDAPPTGDGNVTASFVCRSVRGGSSWSEHARGMAVDINPFQNPYQRGDLVLPELASAYLDRSWQRPGMIVAGDVVTEAFRAIGWRWGGDWSSPDSMHFSASGR